MTDIRTCVSFEDLTLEITKQYEHYVMSPHYKNRVAYATTQALSLISCSPWWSGLDPRSGYVVSVMDKMALQFPLPVLTPPTALH